MTIAPPLSALGLPPRNVRFWVFINDGWVKLTIRPGETLDWSTASRTEEGWDFRAERWELSDQPRAVFNSWFNDGVDCDGYSRSDGTQVALCRELKGAEAVRGQLPEWAPDGIPLWTRVRQRDYRF